MMGGFKQIQATKTDWETREYNFFVVLASKEGKTIFHYSGPEGGSGDGSSMTVPTGCDCHTHPKRIHTGELQQRRQETLLGTTACRRREGLPGGHDSGVEIFRDPMTWCEAWIVLSLPLVPARR
jgi:hypothetical protein